MIEGWLGMISFAHPWLLAALIPIGFLYRIFRWLPPRAKIQRFSAIRLIINLDEPQKRQLQSTPWWIIALRLAILALLCTGLAQPFWRPASPFLAPGPLVIVLDNGWSSAHHWKQFQKAALQPLKNARFEERSVLLIFTADHHDERPRLESARSAHTQLVNHQPQPWPVDRMGAAQGLDKLTTERPAAVYWITDGLKSPHDTSLINSLRRLGPLTVIKVTTSPVILALSENKNATFNLYRSPAEKEKKKMTLLARADQNQALARIDVDFAPSSHLVHIPMSQFGRTAEAVSRVEIIDHNSAAAVMLIDTSWQQRQVGLVTANAHNRPYPLISEHYYLERALSPFAEIISGLPDELIEAGVTTIFVPDQESRHLPQAEKLDSWIEQGGVLVRFSGPQMIRYTEEDRFLPVRPRPGERVFGSTLHHQQSLTTLLSEGPLSGLRLSREIHIKRQVLVEAAPTQARSWLYLNDGTPLVTGKSQGSGYLVLIHVTADTRWSDLVLTGFFVDLLHRLTLLGEGHEEIAPRSLLPWRVLNGLGREENPPPQARALTNPLPMPGFFYPPGWYGTNEYRYAFNLGTSLMRAGNPLQPLAPLPQGVVETNDNESEPFPLGHSAILVAILLFIADSFITLRSLGILPKHGFLSLWERR